jgi:hypothetical protein
VLGIYGFGGVARFAVFQLMAKVFQDVFSADSKFRY